jgi:hypothetical protein
VEEILGIWSANHCRRYQSGIRLPVFRQPGNAPPSSIKIEPSEARLTRGKYLFHHVAACGDCHSQRDFTLRRTVIEGGDGLGFAFPQEMGFPGTVVAPNITPDKETGIGNWMTERSSARFVREA